MKIGGVSYRARTLTDKDYDELNAYVRATFIEESLKAIDDVLLTKEDRLELKKAALLAASNVTFNSTEGSRIINKSTAGVARLGWQMIHHYHSNISIEDFDKMVRGEDENNEEYLYDSLVNIHDAFVELNFSKEDEEDDKEPEEGSDEKKKSDES
jgi:hypothetical protein